MKAVQVYDGDGENRQRKLRKQTDWSALVLKDLTILYCHRAVSFGEDHIEIKASSRSDTNLTPIQLLAGEWNGIDELEGIAVSITLRDGEGRKEGPYVGVVGRVYVQLNETSQGEFYADLYVRLLT